MYLIMRYCYLAFPKLKSDARLLQYIVDMLISDVLVFFKFSFEKLVKFVQFGELIVCVGNAEKLGGALAQSGKGVHDIKK